MLGGAALAAGCGTQAHLDAVAAAKRYAAAHALRGTVRCTSGVGLPYRRRTPDFFCIVGVGTGTCQELRVRGQQGRWTVTLYRRDTDCVLPA